MAEVISSTSLRATVSREERRAVAALLRGRGMPTREVAHRLGVKPQTVREYLWEERGGTRQSRRRRIGPCPGCGRAVGAGRRCRRCAPEARCVWTPARVIEAIELFAHETGRMPRAGDWETARKGVWPSRRTVARIFGGFGVAVALTRARTNGESRHPGSAESRG